MYMTEHEFVKHDLPDAEKPKRRRSSAKRKQSDMTVARKRLQHKRVNEQLAEIYENTDGSMPDMKHFALRPRRRLLSAAATLIGACLFLGVAAWVGFFVFQPQSGFSEDQLALSIAGDQAVILAVGGTQSAPNHLHVQDF